MNGDQSADINTDLIPYLQKRQSSRNRTHDYTQASRAHSFTCEPASEGEEVYMTGQGEDVDRGDYILLQYGCDCVRYQVKEIDHYAEPPDMWIALLKEAND